MTPAEEERHLVRVADRLLSKFPHATAEAANAAVTDAHARFDGKRIREYVLLLVERRAGEALAREEAASAARSHNHHQPKPTEATSTPFCIDQLRCHPHSGRDQISLEAPTQAPGHKPRRRMSDGANQSTYQS
ncbi:hypothetical protein [Rhodococcus sp. IEGM 1379]|uniref:three-helix bundle dimerization domain-containing protein n=1 Tax=Rhodococcus sp. IEGM 1379 TaxID=3047086 RepID=UPI0024B70C0C|nr:hypothetical protein [Rhodococcus sp. IEGM 1379]MDI9913847.1 hypothetical protein [Rhodococcus sp. IEGM 1379]